MARTFLFSEKPDDFDSKVAVSACYVEIQGELLLLHRAAFKEEGNKWGVPAGKIELNETPLETAVRELREETSIQVDPSRVLPLGTLYIRNPNIDYEFHLFQVLLETKPKVTINTESQDYRWATAHDIEGMSLVTGGKEAYRHFCVKRETKKRVASIVSVYLVLKKENSILLGIRKNTGYCDGMWGLPAGHVEDGEPATEAMAREALEELGIHIDPKKLEPMHIIHRQSNRLNVDLFFICSEWEGDITNLEPEKCEDWRFFPIDNLPQNCIRYQRLALEKASAGHFYAELGWD